MSISSSFYNKFKMRTLKIKAQLLQLPTMAFVYSSTLKQENLSETKAE